MIDIGTSAPDFTMPSGEKFSEWRAGRWSVLVAAKALSPTCSTEFEELRRMMPAFAERDIAVAAILADPAPEVDRWLADLLEIYALRPTWPLVNDTALEIAGKYGLVDAAGAGLQRAIVVVAPDGKVAMVVTYPVTNGRNFRETLRAIDAARLTASARVATPARWLPGDPVMLPPSLAQADAEHRYPQGIDVRRDYLRFVTLSPQA